jgi:hypothetical protein
MSGRSVLGGLLMALLLSHCGGETSANPASVGVAQTMSDGAGGAADECGGAPAGGCNDAGNDGVDSTTGIHTACHLNVKVNRRGKPVCIDYHIR